MKTLDEVCETTAAMDKKAKKRMYDRRQQLKKRAELSRLQALVTELEAQSEQLQYLKKGMLPWKDVAIALSRESMLAIDANVNLKQSIRHYERLATYLSKWVHEMTTICRTPSSLPLTCRQTSLPMKDTSRHVGFDWITKQMYHNIPRFLESSQIPSIPQDYFSCDVAWMDDTYLQTSYTQHVEQASLQVVRAFLQAHVLHMPGYDLTLDETESDTVYRRYNVPYASGEASYYENTLMREFVDENRVIVVVQTVSEDEKYPNRDVRRDWLQWVVADRLNDNTTVIKTGTIATGLRGPNGYVPIEECSTFKHELLLTDDQIRRDSIYRKRVYDYVYRSHEYDIWLLREFTKSYSS